MFTLFYAAASGFLSTIMEKAAAAAVASFVIALAVDRLCRARIAILWTQGVARVETWINESSAEIVAWIDACQPTALRFALVAAAGLSLFLELVLIRWESGLFAIFALYKNFTLLSCFCGLGIGYAKAHDRQLTIAASLPMTLALMAIFVFLRYGTGAIGAGMFQVVPVREEVSVFFGFTADTNFWSYLLGSLPVYFLLALTFLLNTLALLPVGQLCGRLMQRIPPLESYGYNLLGSLAGVGLLFLLSWAWAGPVIWFGMAAAVLLFFQLFSRTARKIAAGSAIGCILVAAWPVTPLIQTIYSPYQMIERTSQPNGLMSLLISGAYFQKVYDLSLGNASRETDPELRRVVGYYELPFKTAPSLTQVAIVGAGSGNDVASALRSGASHVDAVEIDPAIRDLGIQNHPEHPYQDSRVRSVINDARNFFRTTTTFYDAIVYGVLDSHIVVSHGNNMRVDSFVYTREGLQDAFDHLKPGGLMSVAFALPRQIMGEKVFQILRALPRAGAPVAVLTSYDSVNTTTFMVRKGAEVNLPAEFLKRHALTDITPAYIKMQSAKLDLPSDDWPFFYMEKKMYPETYLLLLALVLVIAYLMVRGLLPAASWQPPLLSYFFLGGGFMLVETKAITELGLLLGNTWQVVGITIGSVLVMAFLANLCAARIARPSMPWTFAGLFLVLLAGYALAAHGSVPAASFDQKLLTIAILIGPLFFSGLVFSALIKSTKDLPAAMAYNLMGAMLGGALEYNSMRFGFSSLYLIALVLYGLAWLTMRSSAEHARMQAPLSPLADGELA
ncbi:MAG: spermine/spermidine synthase domain-containing protein [Rhizomicrobium sp.]